MHTYFCSKTFLDGYYGNVYEKENVDKKDIICYFDKQSEKWHPCFKSFIKRQSGFYDDAKTQAYLLYKELKQMSEQRILFGSYERSMCEQWNDA